MKKEIVNVASDEQLSELRSLYPSSDTFQRIQVPRLGMLAKDIAKEEGTGKKKTIVIEQASGTFYIEREKQEEGENGEMKRVWTREFFDDVEAIEATIIYHSKQLRLCDDSTEMYVSSPIFDNKDEIVPLFCDRKEIKRGAQAELQALYPALTAKGKPSSKLKEEKILYVIYKGELFQMNLSQSSKYSFLNYSKNVNPATVITKIGSLEQTHGTNTYKQMTFVSVKPITKEQADLVINMVREIKNSIAAEKSYFTEKSAEVVAAEKTFAEM